VAEPKYSFTKHSLSQVMTVREVSEYLRVHPTTVYRLLRGGKVPAFRVGSDWRFNVEAIDRWRLQTPSPARRLSTSTVLAHWTGGNRRCLGSLVHAPVGVYSS
jgi:excisionase family DNA binding protein